MDPAQPHLSWGRRWRRRWRRRWWRRWWRRWRRRWRRRGGGVGGGGGCGGWPVVRGAGGGGDGGGGGAALPPESVTTARRPGRPMPDRSAPVVRTDRQADVSRCRGLLTARPSPRTLLMRPTSRTRCGCGLEPAARRRRGDDRRGWPAHLEAARGRLLGELDAAFADRQRALAQDRIGVAGDLERDGSVALALRPGDNRDPSGCRGRRPRTLPRDGYGDGASSAAGGERPRRRIEARLTASGRCGGGRDARRGRSATRRQRDDGTQQAQHGEPPDSAARRPALCTSSASRALEERRNGSLSPPRARGRSEPRLGKRLPLSSATPVAHSG